MKIEDFRAGEFIPQFRYESFSPSKINHNWNWDNTRINTLLAEANQRNAELNAFSLYVPNIGLFLKMHLIKEATDSSRIEGTKTGVEEALLAETEIEPENRDDWQEVQNYIAALNYSIEELQHLPIFTRLIKSTHAVLMQGVRGKRKYPGEFRDSQNWIGGATIADAIFIPPHHSEVSELMGDLESFLHNEKIEVPHLIRIAIAHYQFETIHPFLDGNGRMGRLLIVLYLINCGVLNKPVLYISDYLEKHRTLYYENLNRVRLFDDMSQWIKFFLVAVIETSNKGIFVFRSIIRLQNEIFKKLENKSKRNLSKATDLMELLYNKPVITISEVSAYLSVHPSTAISLINNFIELGILREITGRKRNRLFEFSEYLILFKE